MIGCMEDARLIGEWDHNYPLPPGWHYVNEGEERAVYISPDHIIYKVELNRCGANRDEYLNICLINEMEPVENWRVPQAMLYELDKFHTVIAMEYIEGQPAAICGSMLTMSCVCDCGSFPCEGIEWEMISRIWGIIDLTSDNIRVMADGTKVLVDVTR